MPPKKVTKAKREPGPWIKHVKNFAKIYEVCYPCALINPECSRTYKTGEKITHWRDYKFDPLTIKKRRKLYN